MPFLFLIIGLMLIVIAARNQTANAVTLLKSEFTGPQSFIQWFLAVGTLGAVGYIPKLRPVANGLLVLVILSMVITEQKNKGLFQAFENAVQNSPAINNNQSATTAIGSQGTNSFGTVQGPLSFPNQMISTPNPSGSNFPSGQSSYSPYQAFPSGGLSIPNISGWPSF